MPNSIYSLVLSDDIVEEVDALAQAAGLSRSAMVNTILAERVARVTPEMRMRELFAALERSMREGFALLPSTANTFSARTALKFRYKPTVKYAVELRSKNGRREGELRVSLRTQSAELIALAGDFFRFWIELERRYNSSGRSVEVESTLSELRFVRSLNVREDGVSDERLGRAVADYIALFDSVMKGYFANLPDTAAAEDIAEIRYSMAVSGKLIII